MNRLSPSPMIVIRNCLHMRACAVYTGHSYKLRALFTLLRAPAWWCGYYSNVVSIQRNIISMNTIFKYLVCILFHVDKLCEHYNSMENGCACAGSWYQAVSLTPHSLGMRLVFGKSREHWMIEQPNLYDIQVDNTYNTTEYLTQTYARHWSRT